MASSGSPVICGVARIKDSCNNSDRDPHALEHKRVQRCVNPVVPAEDRLVGVAENQSSESPIRLEWLCVSNKTSSQTQWRAGPHPISARLLHCIANPLNVQNSSRPS